MNHLRFAAVTVATLALVGCATTSEPGAVRASDRAIALREAWRLSHEVDQSLTAGETAVKAGDTAKAQSSLADAKAKLSDPNISLSSKKKSLDQRASDLEKELASSPAPAVAEAPAAPAAPVAVAAPAPTSAPVAEAPVAAPAKAPVSDKVSLADAVAGMVKARAGIHGHELAKSDVEAAEKARDVLGGALEANKDADGATDAAQLLEDANNDIRLANLIADFVAGPGASQKKGAELSSQAKGEKNAKKRKSELKQAREAFASCETDSLKMISDEPVLNRTALFLATTRTSPKKIAAACAKDAKALGKKLASK